MGIKDLLAPKWKHTNPDMRLQAIADMESDQVEIFTEIVTTDTDVGVRQKALERIEDPAVLESILEQVSDGDILPRIHQRIDEIYANLILRYPEKVQGDPVALLDRLSGEDALTRVCLATEDPAIREAVVARVHRPNLLCDIARSHCGLKAGLMVVEKLDQAGELEWLEVVANQASNKKVRKAAHERLEAFRNPGTDDVVGSTEEPESDSMVAQLTQLCVSMEQMVLTRETAVQDRRFRLDRLWDQLDPDRSHSLRHRFDAACQRVDGWLQTMEQKRQINTELETVCQDMETLTRQMPEDACARSEAIKDRFERLIQKEIVADDVHTWRARFDRVWHRFQSNLEDVQQNADQMDMDVSRLAALCDAFEAIGNSNELEKARSDWQDLEVQWRDVYVESDDTIPFHQRKVLARKKLDQRIEDDMRRQESRLIALCEQLEGLIDAQERRGLEHQVRDIEKSWKSDGILIPDVKEKLQDRFQLAMDRFFEKQREFWDHQGWQRWANLTKKEELCKVVETLAQQPDLAGVATGVRNAQAAWKQIGAVDRDKSQQIWQRFMAACDRAYERCLAEKKELLDQVTRLTSLITHGIEDLDRQFSWNDTGQQIKAIQARWNEIGPLPRSMEKEIRESFQSACNLFFKRRREFFSQRDQQRKINLERKTALVQQAESLMESTDWINTSNRLKQLQKEWKTIGPVPKSQSMALWHRFQNACNTFFDRLEASKPENQRKKEALCQEAEALMQSITCDADVDGLNQRFVDMQREWKAIGPVPSEVANTLWERFHSQCDAFFVRRRQRQQVQEQEQIQNQQKKEAIVAQAEDLAQSTDWKSTADQLKQLQTQWKTIGSAKRSVEQALWKRFRAACDTFFSRQKQHFENLDATRQQNLETKRQLCLQMEVLLKLVLPDKEIPHDPEVSMARQLAVSLDYKSNIAVAGDIRATWDRVLTEARKLQNQWKQTGPAPKAKDTALWKRFSKASDLLFASRPMAGNTPKEPQAEAVSTQGESS